MSQPSYFQRLRGSIRRIVDHFGVFGPVSLTRFLHRSRREFRWPVKGAGPMTLRIDSSDAQTIRQVFIGREYDLAKTGGAEGRVDEALASILGQGKVPVIIDAGANIGAATLWFRHRFPGAHIVAIEPEPDNVRILRANLAGLDNVTLAQVAIAGERGAVSIPDGATGWDVTTQRSSDGAISAITMADALAMVPNGAPFIAKIDIEGFEADLFAGDTGWIDGMTMIMIEPHDWMMPGRFTSANFQREMGRRRFELFINGENLIYIAA